MCFVLLFTVFRTLEPRGLATFMGTFCVFEILSIGFLCCQPFCLVEVIGIWACLHEKWLFCSLLDYAIFPPRSIGLKRCVLTTRKYFFPLSPLLNINIPHALVALYIFRLCSTTLLFKRKPRPIMLLIYRSLIWPTHWW